MGDQRRSAANRGSIVNLFDAMHGDQADRMACSRVGNLAVRERDIYPLVERKKVHGKRMHVHPNALLVGDENQAPAADSRSPFSPSAVYPPVSSSRLIYHRDIARARAHSHWQVSKWLCTTCKRDCVTYARNTA